MQEVGPQHSLARVPGVLWLWVDKLHWLEASWGSTCRKPPMQGPKRL